MIANMRTAGIDTGKDRLDVAVHGEKHPISLAQDGWHLRDYQEMATESFWAGGSGVVVLPCGAGKTLVGAGARPALAVTMTVEP